MNYQYDIFLSYRRLGETQSWIQEFFSPLIVTHLSQDLGRHPKLFFDKTEIETGSSWPNILSDAIASSKIIIILWSRKYLESKWCSCEIGHMLEREKLCGYRTAQNPKGLIFPVIINDGESMPIHLSTIQSLKMQEYFKLTLSKDGKKYTEFEDKVKELVASLSDALDNAPEWQQNWEIAANNSFSQQLHISQESIQSQPPKFISQ